MEKTVELMTAQALSGITDVLQKAQTAEVPRPAKDIAESNEVKEFLAKGTDLVRFELKTAITSTNSALNDPLAVPHKPVDIAPLARRRINVLDILPQYPTEESGAIEFGVVETVTDNAGSQVGGSPEAYQNVAKPEAVLTFRNEFQPIVTVAEWIPVSTQVVADSAGLQALIETELAYHVRRAVDAQLLTGTGSNHTLDGLLQNAASVTLSSPEESTLVNKIIRAQMQSLQADYSPSHLILNGVDYETLVKAYGAPGEANASQFFDMRVIVNNSLTAGTFLVVDSQQAGVAFVRENLRVELSRHDSTNFQDGMVSLRAEMRLAFCPTQASNGAAVKGGV